MPVGGVDRTDNAAQVQNARAEEARAENERRRVQMEQAQEANRARPANRGNNTDVTV